MFLEEPVLQEAIGAYREIVEHAPCVTSPLASPVCQYFLSACCSAPQVALRCARRVRAHGARIFETALVKIQYIYRCIHV